MKLNLWICGLMTTALLACSSKPVEAPAPAEAPRDPANAEASLAEEMERSYQFVMSQNEPEREFSALIERTARIYFKAAGLIEKFDQEISKMPVAPADGEVLPLYFQSETYAKIQAARALRERLETKLIFYYSRLNMDRDAALETAKSDAAASAEAQRLSKIRKSVHETLKKYAQNENIFPVEELIEEAVNYHLTTSGNVAASVGPTVPADLKQLRSKSLGSWQALSAALKKYNSQIREQIKKSESDTSDDREIEIEAGAIQGDYAAYFASLKNREPAQAAGKKIFPADNSSGNIVGGAFLPKTWVLTFDDGPHGRFTMDIMKSMESGGYKATFFWLGQNVRLPQMKPIIDYAKAHNHVLANHSQTHMNFGAVRAGNFPGVIASEIDQPTRIQTQAYGYKPKFYRCPYGACNKIAAIRQALRDRGYIHAFWAVDSLDWNKAANPQGAASIVARVKKQMAAAGKGVILFHDIHPQSAAATAQLIPYLKQLEKQGYRFVDLCQAVDEANGDPLGTVCAH